MTKKMTKLAPIEHCTTELIAVLIMTVEFDISLDMSEIPELESIEAKLQEYASASIISPQFSSARVYHHVVVAYEIPLEDFNWSDIKDKIGEEGGCNVSMSKATIEMRDEF